MWTVFLLIAMLRVLYGCFRSISISDMLVMKQSLITSYIQWASNTLFLNYSYVLSFFLFSWKQDVSVDSDVSRADEGMLQQLP